jgi:aminoglycoside/choline kinase family phosphotransferase
MASPPREAQRLAWTRAALGDPRAMLASASADASFRSYWRCRSDGRSWIVMDAPPGREDVRPWLDVAGRLGAGGLHAPQVLASDADQGFVLMSDLGTRTYLPELDEGSVDALYADALAALLAMQTRVDCAGLPDYDENRLVAEMELMPEWFLQRHLGLAPDCGQWDEIEVAFRELVRNARIQPQAFVHRDYHSRNLMVVADNNPGIVDFQDAVRGPISYDLVSLLRDCYVEWPEQRVYGWVDGYHSRAVAAGLTDVDGATFRRGFDLMGLQRHLKVLGIFCRLWYRDGKAGYLNDLPLVWKYTRTIGGRYPETAPLIALVEQAIGDRDISLPLA